MTRPETQGIGAATTALIASAATLVCCVLPAVLVSLGAGAVLVSLVSAVPQLVWLSEHKLLVFGVAAAVLAIAGGTLWRARRLPCPADPGSARRCRRLRTISRVLYGLAVTAFAAGFAYAFALPALNR